MANAGRKRKFEAKRRASGKVIDKVQTSNPVVLAKRMAAAKDIRADADNPLSVMFYSGQLRLTDEHNEQDAQNRYDAGAQFAGLYYRLFGKPFARGANLNAARGRDSVDPVRALADEIAYSQAVRALDRLGRNTRRIVIDCCVHLEWSGRHLDRLIVGLDALNNLPRPRISEEMKDRAKAEMAA